MPQKELGCAASRSSRNGPASTARRPAPRGLGREPVLRSGDRPGSGAPGCPSGPGRTTPGAGGPPAVARSSPRCASDLLRQGAPHGRRDGSADRGSRPRGGWTQGPGAGRSRGGGSRERHPSRRADRSGSRTRSSDRPSTRRPHRRRSAAFTAGWRSWSSTSRSGLATSPCRPPVRTPTWRRRSKSAAQHARARGAPDAAAGLGELARQLTPLEDEEGLRRRSMDAAEYHFDAGDAPRAIALLEEAAASSPPGPGRAELLFRLSSMSWMNLERGVRDPLERALLEAGDDPELVAGIHLDLAWVDIYQGDLAAASEHARRSIDQSDRVIDPATKADALSTFGMVEFLSGQTGGRRRCPRLSTSRTSGWRGDRGPKRRSTPPRVPSSASSRCGRGSSTRPGRRSSTSSPSTSATRCSPSARRSCATWQSSNAGPGRWHVAEAYAAEAMETVVESGQTATQRHVVLFNQALAAAHLGQVDVARSWATEGVHLALSNDDPFNANWNRAVLGFLSLSLGEHEHAHEHLEPVVRYLDRMGSAEPGIIPCIPDAIEALISLGRLDEAGSLLDRLTEQGRAMRSFVGAGGVGSMPWAPHGCERRHRRSARRTRGGAPQAQRRAAAVRARSDPDGERTGGTEGQAEARRALQLGSKLSASSSRSGHHCGRSGPDPSSPVSADPPHRASSHRPSDRSPNSWWKGSRIRRSRTPCS